MAEQFGRQPTVVLSDETQRTSGKDALSMNIEAGAAVAEAVRTTLGPRGMDKMLVSGSGDVVVTNDGVTVLSEMDVDHPAAEMIVEVAETQEAEVGDGTTTSVVVAGALLNEAEDLVEQGLHPSTVVEGYRTAGDHIPGLLEEVTIDVAPEDTELLEGIARTALTGKGAESAIDELAPMVVEAVRRTVSDGEPTLDAVKVHSFQGGSIADSRLVEGLMVDREPDHQNMTIDREDADILVVDGPLELSEAETDPEIEVGSMDELDEFIEREREEADRTVGAITDLGADVVFTTEAVDDPVKNRLADEGVFSSASLRDPDVEKLLETTGATPVTDVEDAAEEDLGYTGDMHQEVIRKKYGGGSSSPDKTTVITGLEEAGAVTLLVRGSTEHVVDEVERAVEDALTVVAETLSDGRVVPGGGAPEVSTALGLREAAEGVEGRQQLAVERVADALETIPRTLAENGGFSPVDAVVDIRSSHDAGNDATGIDVHTGEVVDTGEAGVVEPLRVKTQAFEAGIEAVNSILRIDDVVSAGDLQTADDDEADDGGAGGPDMNPYA